MTQAGTEFLNEIKKSLDPLLPGLIGARKSEFAPESDGIARLFEATEYALKVGGKRFRPALLVATSRALGVIEFGPALLHAAASLEFMHTYSLVHDDLPAMDDDDLRRGLPSCHRAYDEATAILVGDALQARAFEVLIEAPQLDPQQKVDLIATLSAAGGGRGMVGGQAIDTAMVERQLTYIELECMHRLKTGALIQAAVEMGCILAQATEQERHSLSMFAQAVGLAFQIKDDILDVEGSTARLGKTGGKDASQSKPTFVSSLGLDEAKRRLEALREEAVTSLDSFGKSAEPLRSLAGLVADRDH